MMPEAAASQDDVPASLATLPADVLATLVVHLLDSIPTIDVCRALARIARVCKEAARCFRTEDRVWEAACLRLGFASDSQIERMQFDEGVTGGMPWRYQFSECFRRLVPLPRWQHFPQLPYLNNCAVAFLRAC